MTLQEAKGILAVYQTKLGLSEWRIELKWGKPSELVVEGSCGKLYGFVFWDQKRKKAWVTLNKEYSYSEIVETIKHELLHIRLEGHMDEPLPENSFYEKSLDAIASIL